MNKYDMKIRDQSRLVKSILRSYGHTVKDFARPWSPFDILMDGKIKIEVKTCSYSSKRKYWLFNIHRHNVLNEANVDFYVLRFNDVPGTNRAINALYRAPLNVSTMVFSMRELLEGKIHQAVKDFRSLNLKSKKVLAR